MRLLSSLVLFAFLTLAASAQAATVAIPGSPMTVYVNDVGNVTGRLAGDSQNVFFPPSENDSPNAGFTLGFPDAVGTIAAGSNFGPIGSSFTAFSQGGLTGAGTGASPYQVMTVYKASDAAEVTQTVTYVNGQTRFAVSYSVRNPTSGPVRFRAGLYADLYLAGSDVGSGILLPGPPRFVAGLNVDGRFGGFEEAAASPWSRFEEDDFSTVSSNLANLAGPGLDNTVNPTVVDNGAAVQWDEPGLPAGATATFRTAYVTAAARPPTPPTPPIDNSIDAQLARLPAPKLGTAVNVAPVSGEVFVKLPAGSAAHAAQSKGRGFVSLRQAKQIPVGSQLDTTRGKVRLVSAANASGKRQQGDFDGAFFKTIQSRSGKGLTELRLTKGKFSGCRVRARRSNQAGAARRRYKRRTVRRLTGSANGRFRTRGRYASATVRGTNWTVTDRCDGTLTRVKSGVVVVRDVRRRKNFVVKAGKSRLVRAPG